MWFQSLLSFDDCCLQMRDDWDKRMSAPGLFNECVCSLEWEKEKTGVLEEITPHSLRVLVTHALVAAERFPHLHAEERAAAPTAPPVSLPVPAESPWDRIFLKKRRGGGGKH